MLPWQCFLEVRLARGLKWRCGLAEGWREIFQRQGRRLVNNRAELSMNYVEDNEYLGSCESLCLLVLMVREWVLSCTTAGLPSWMTWYNL